MSQRPNETRPCAMCQKPLKLSEQYGSDYLEPLCWNCYAQQNRDAGGEIWYGLAPHDHAYDEQGNIIIGGTTFKPLPEPDEHGDYDFGDRTFHPDPEAPGCGTWEMKCLPGWK